MVKKNTTTKSKVAPKSKLVIIEEIYGKSTGATDINETVEFLKKAGYKSLADIFQPAKQ
jgi:hypothetical protein